MEIPSTASIVRQTLRGFHVGRLLRLRARLPWLRHRPLLVTEDGTWTYAQVYREARRYGRLFRAWRRDAVQRGELAPDAPLTIGLYEDNTPGFLFAVFGAALEGDLVVGLNTGFRGETLSAVLNRADVRLVITSPWYLEFLEPALAGCPGLSRDRVLLDSDTAVPGLRTLTEALMRAVGGRRTRRPKAADPLLVIYTSGTTGVPKGIPCAHLKLLGAGALIAHRIGLRADDRGYLCMPLFHSNAWLLGIMPTLFAGGSLLLKRRFSASAFEHDILEHGVTWMNYVGQPVHYILAALEEHHGSPEAVERALARHPDNRFRIATGNGATAVDREKLQRYLDMEHIYELYGSTEAVISTVLMPGDPPDSVGEVTSPRVVILDEQDRECPPAEVDGRGRIRNYDRAVGEIAARVDRDNLLFDGYFRNPDATDRKYRDGYFHSGDLGHIRVINGKRYLYFDGRTDDWIRKDGENFSAESVAACGQRLPDAALAAAYGVPDPVADERVALALQLEPGRRFDPEAVHAHFLEQQRHGGMDPKWMPDFIRVVERMPMSGTNKILTRHLKRQHFHLERHPDMEIWFRERGDDRYHRLTPEAFRQLRGEFRRNGREQLLETG